MNSHDHEDDFEMPKLNIRQENEFKKMKMNLENGAIFPDDLSKQLPPEIEGHFLDSIISFEKAFRNAKKTTVFHKIGKPSFVPENVLNDNEVAEELEKIETILRQNGLNLEVLADYDDEERLIYKFITEELFDLEIDDINITGFNTNFIYEDFCPNNKYDIERNTVDFLNIFFNKKSDTYEKNYQNNLINQNQINIFRSLFKKFKLKNFEVNEIEINKELAEICFNIDFWGKIAGTDSKISFSGLGTIYLELKNGFWTVVNVILPTND